MGDHVNREEVEGGGGVARHALESGRGGCGESTCFEDGARGVYE